MPGGEIHFKTDNDPLFDFTLEEMAASGWETTCVTRDLHKSEWDADNLRTEFETKYAEQGIPIKRVVGIMRERPEPQDAAEKADPEKKDAPADAAEDTQEDA